MPSMEPLPPAKRARVGHAPWDDDDGEAEDDELMLSASQFDARQHPMYQLDKKRAQSALKLKSRFEDIFEKYGKDFEGVGDEIDLLTGEVIVDNGHLQSLEDEDQDKSEDDQEEAEVLQDVIQCLGFGGGWGGGEGTEGDRAACDVRSRFRHSHRRRSVTSSSFGSK